MPTYGIFGVRVTGKRIGVIRLACEKRLGKATVLVDTTPERKHCLKCSQPQIGGLLP